MTSRNRSMSVGAATSHKSRRASQQNEMVDNTATVTAEEATVHEERRESLVKPTWHNISPGQIPLKTLEKINGILSDTDNDDDSDHRDEGEHCVGRRSSLYTNHHHYHHHSHNCNHNHQHQQHLHPILKQSGGGGNGSGRGGGSKYQAVRKCSSSHLAQLTRKGSLVVYRDALQDNAAVTRRASHGDACGRKHSLVSVSSGDRSNSVPCKTTGWKFMRMLTQKCAIHSHHSECDLMAKVIMLGDSGVGKTSLLIMFRDGIYVPCYYVTTVGIDFMNKVVIVDGTRVKLQIWDTAGQERFRSVTHAYYRDAHALLLMYDVTNKVTYDNIRAWLCEIRDCAQEDVVIVLIGNKADCSSSERQVKREDGERLAREHKVPFMETSAKSGQNVELAFQTVARQLKNRGYEQDDEGKFNVHEFVRENTKAKSVCAQCNL